MKKSKFLVLIVIMIFILNSNLLLTGQDTCKPPPLDEPGGDKPDDNYSMSSGINNMSITGIGSISIFQNGFFKNLESVLNKSNNTINFIDLSGNYNPDLAVFPSGSFFGKNNDTGVSSRFGKYRTLRLFYKIFI